MVYISLSLLFSSSGHNLNSKQHIQKDNSSIPTYISISPRKDGTTAKTKCLNPQQHRPLKRKLKMSSNFSAILPKFRVRGSSHHHRTPSLYSSSSSNHNIQVTRPKASFITLPAEIMTVIINNLDYTSIHKLSRTCSSLYYKCHDEQLWRKMLYADFKSVPPPLEKSLVVYNQKQRVAAKYTQISRRASSKLIHTAPSTSLVLYQNHLRLEKRWLTGKVNTRFLQGHDDSVYCLAWISKDYLVSGSRDKSIKVWHVPSNKCVKTISSEHEGSILCMRGDLSSQTLISGSSDATCTVWAIVSNGSDIQPLVKLRGHGHSVLGACITKNKIITCSKDHTVRVWDKMTGLELLQLRGHRASVNAIEPVGDDFVASASGDSNVKLWNIHTGECVKTMQGHTLGLASVRYDGKYLYSGGLDGKIRVWDIQTGECVNILVGHAGMIRSIDYINGKIVSGSYDRTLKVWDTKTGACNLSFQSGHSSWIFNVLLSGTQIVSSGQEKRIMVIDFGTGLTL